MTVDFEFRSELTEMLESEADDREIVEFVLDHAWNRWPHSFHVWLNGKIEHMDFFGGTRYTKESPKDANEQIGDEE